MLLKLVLSANWHRDSQSQQLIFPILLTLRKDIEAADIVEGDLPLQE